MEVPGFEPGAFHMRSERDTTTPHSRLRYCPAIAFAFKQENTRTEKPMRLIMDFSSCDMKSI